MGISRIAAQSADLLSAVSTRVRLVSPPTWYWLVCSFLVAHPYFALSLGYRLSAAGGVQLHKVMAIQCPRCLSKDIRRSRRGGVVDIILSHLFLDPFRCRNCRKRFFRSADATILWEPPRFTPRAAVFPHRSTVIQDLRPARKPIHRETNWPMKRVAPNPVLHSR